MEETTQQSVEPQLPTIPTNAKAFNFGRPVEINDIDYRNGEKPRKRLGTFHIWGYQRSGGRERAPTMQTIAVVELEDGRITTKRPDQITFVDRKGPS